ncbi:hypothetical protein CWB96_21580 [Pseudoalteromonas citrea]|uniref:Lipoprotein n=1 Tax=Pseudoalteromonas citrea TaxID=43655 RepID=A0A5S3XI76_9GAMM|nr:hypothetical protein [Pseudoalteromonas citrea]TMP42371.1 hypothetical protein CWB97_12150 [Pseudoalteromonas citrea]TMP52831.1 hypothetical protein CWB96_21580 [Pseudoalteromonas citrea]
MKKPSFLICIASAIALTACGSDNQVDTNPLCDDDDVIELVDEIVKDEAKSQLFEVMLKKAGKSGEITYQQAVDVAGRSAELDGVIALVNETIDQQQLIYSNISMSEQDLDQHKVWCSAGMGAEGKKPAIINYTALHTAEDVEVYVTF